ncbi:hypothetical protein LUZ63_017022 [Rhynchospora breviuscula]|uniref:F-box domain-containing protein n=1 Tax=Rhynchospora breviuscula TaxID=2022672 RepID=A0A9Q0HEZ2_9POAL|nr:hypothetical protein LUZ63_017022 [Rhynchospora breviuscula]
MNHDNSAALQPMEDEDGDRISSLPLEIIISILCCLDIRYAVRTSALARSWRHHWKLLPCLCVDRFLPELQDALTPDNCSLCPVGLGWMNKVHHVLSSLQGPVLVFKLSHYFRSYQSPKLQSLLDLLLERAGVQLQSLCLFSHLEPVFVHLPFFHSLKVLQLHACNVILPTGFSGFKRLITLDFEKVYISHDDFHFLIRTSNNLTTFRNLGFVTANLPLSVNLSCPLLRHLHFEISESIEKVSVVSAPCLEEAHICIKKLTGSQSEKFASVTLGLLTSVANVSSLKLDCHVLQSLSLVTLPFNFTFPRLRCLKLFWGITTMDLLYDTFLRLLRSMPFLEKLHLVIGLWPTNWNRNKTRELIGWKQEGLPCLDQSLKRVTISIHACDPFMTSITVAKFFLLNAKVLKLMKVQYLYQLYGASAMSKELHGADVTSSDAIVVFLDLMGNVI